MSTNKSLELDKLRDELANAYANCRSGKHAAINSSEWHRSFEAYHAGFDKCRELLQVENDKLKHVIEVLRLALIDVKNTCSQCGEDAEEELKRADAIERGEK